MAKRTKKSAGTNGYSAEDLKQIIDEIEGYEADKASIMAEAAGRCSGLAKRIANAKKTARSLNIPAKPLSALLKTRKLERKIEETAKSLDDMVDIEVFEDMIGQFSFLAPIEGEGKGAAKVAAERQRTAAEENEERELEEGGKLLDEVLA